jgi:transmembrane sensor
MNTGRSVVLTGEAFFDVAKAPETFRVAAGEAVITVLGTRFAVRSWPSEARTSVYLEEGSVSIESVTETSGAPLVMEPGQSVSASGSSVAINHDFSAEAALAWRTGDFVFVNAALGQVLDDVGRRFGVRIARGPGVDAGRMVNGAFRQPSDPGSVLGDLALSLGLNYRETSDGFEVFRP